MRLQFTTTMVVLALAGCNRASALPPQDAQVAHCIAALNAAAVVVARSGNSVVERQLRVRALYEGSKLRDHAAVERAKAEAVTYTKDHLLADPKEADQVTRECLRQEDADPQFAAQAPRFAAEAAQLSSEQAQ